jgi:hypothetical protein
MIMKEIGIMTKKELIEALEPYDDDIEITVDNWVDGDGDYTICNISTKFDEDEEKLIVIAIDV